jgi:hypothetical protein
MANDFIHSPKDGKMDSRMCASLQFFGNLQHLNNFSKNSSVYLAVKNNEYFCKLLFSVFCSPFSGKEKANSIFEMKDQETTLCNAPKGYV